MKKAPKPYLMYNDLWNFWVHPENTFVISCIKDPSQVLTLLHDRMGRDHNYREILNKEISKVKTYDELPKWVKECNERVKEDYLLPFFDLRQQKERLDSLTKDNRVKRKYYASIEKGFSHYQALRNCSLRWEN